MLREEDKETIHLKIQLFNKQFPWNVLYFEKSIKSAKHNMHFSHCYLVLAKVSRGKSTLGFKKKA